MSDYNRDLYQWDGSDVNQRGQSPGGQSRDMYQWDGSDQRSQQQDAVGPDRFTQEIYDPRNSQGRRYEVSRGGGDNINLVVYGDVYINQGGSWGRTDGRREYYGRQYSYNQYVDPRYRQSGSYEDYAYQRQQRRHPGYTRSGYYDDGRNYGYGNTGAYDAYGNQQYSGGYSRRGYCPPNYYEGGTWGGSGFAQGGCYPSDFDRGAQVFDMILRGAQTYFAYDIARRAVSGRHHHRGGAYGDQGYGGYGNQYGGRRGNYQHGWQRRRGGY
ncbi:MAG: hypothetical protein HY711_08525 [Candidatus Melainabacteria bacterium]|nr:hypothetical protein [Candidatus Melainabacteria bacterium]